MSTEQRFIARSVATGRTLRNATEAEAEKWYQRFLHGHNEGPVTDEETRQPVTIEPATPRDDVLDGVGANADVSEGVNADEQQQ